MFDSPFGEGLFSRARENGLLDLRAHDLRDYTLNKHRKVDDCPFGGGAGMVMNVEPIVRAIEAVKKDRPRARTILMSASGKPFDQKKAWELSREDEILLVCGRYEGVDERVGLHFVDEEISIGDFVLSGGEIPAMVLIDAVSRLVPGVVGDEACIRDESFTADLLEYPQYTRPQEFRGQTVPEILISGDHQKIRDWQRQAAREKTARIRPDLLKNAKTSEQDRTAPGKKP